MKRLSILVFMLLSAPLGTIAQIPAEGTRAQLDDVVEDTGVYCDGIRFFRRTYDVLSVDESLMAVAEIKEAGVALLSEIDEIVLDSLSSKNQVKQLKKVDRKIRAIDKSLDKLVEYIQTQNYKSRLSSPGSHSPVETKYFRLISDAVKDIQAASAQII